MGNRFGGVAAVVAIAAAIALSLGVILVGHAGVDYAHGTYTYDVRADLPNSGATVLVQDGVVTDVWGAEAGETPQSPARSFIEGTTVEVDGSTTRLCNTNPDASLDCREYENVVAMSSAKASALAAWPGLPDGDYAIAWETPWWQTTGTTPITIANGTVTDAQPADELLGRESAEWLTAHGSWVRYWSTGSDQPFAICYDDPNGADEEVCYTW